MSESDRPERRTDVRKLSCIPAYVESNQQHLALIRDVSLTGALLFTRSKFEVGEPVHLSLYLAEGAKEARRADGRVVRAVERAGDRDVWNYEVGVQFDEPIEQYADEIEKLRERQAKIGVLKG